MLKRTYGAFAASALGLVSMVGTAGASAWAGAGSAVSVVMAAPVTSTGAIVPDDSAAGASAAAASVVAAGVSSATTGVGSAFSV